MAVWTKEYNVPLRTATRDQTRPPPDPYSALKPHVANMVPIKYTTIRPGVLIGNLADAMIQAQSLDAILTETICAPYTSGVKT